jgi:hypothetical protein
MKTFCPLDPCSVDKKQTTDWEEMQTTHSAKELYLPYQDPSKLKSDKPKNPYRKQAEDMKCIWPIRIRCF